MDDLNKDKPSEFPDLQEIEVETDVNTLLEWLEAISEQNSCFLDDPGEYWCRRAVVICKERILHLSEDREVRNFPQQSSLYVNKPMIHLLKIVSITITATMIFCNSVRAIRIDGQVFCQLTIQESEDEPKTKILVPKDKTRQILKKLTTVGIGVIGINCRNEISNL